MCIILRAYPASLAQLDLKVGSECAGAISRARWQNLSGKGWGGEGRGVRVLDGGVARGVDVDTTFWRWNTLGARAIAAFTLEIDDCWPQGSLWGSGRLDRRGRRPMAMGCGSSARRG